MTILTNTNINTLPVIEDYKDQLHRQLWSEYVPIYTPINRLPPFQIITDLLWASMIIEVYDIFDNLLQTIDNTEAGVGVEVEGTNYTIWYCLGGELSVDLPDKLVYCKYRWFVAGEEFNLYTEIFKPVSDTSTLVELTWWNDYDIPIAGGELKASFGGTQFYFKSFIKAYIAQPEWTFIDNVDDREGYDYILSIISDKHFNFKFRTTELLMDALRVMRGADYIAISNKLKLYKVLYTEIGEASWSENGGSFDVEIKFKVDSIVKKISQAKPTLGDFNNDFNDDFL